MVIVFCCRLHSVMFRRIALENHPPAQRAAPGAACHLHQKLEGAFRRTEVRQVKAYIGGNGAHQCHQGQIQPLGDHLRAYQHVGFVGGETLQDLLMAALFARGVGVPA